jgi:hypothetical protein
VAGAERLRGVKGKTLAAAEDGALPVERACGRRSELSGFELSGFELSGFELMWFDLIGPCLPLSFRGFSIVGLGNLPRWRDDRFQILR